MNAATRNYSAAGIALAAALLVFAGCQTQNEPIPTEKQARLLAAENIALKQELLDTQAMIEKVRQQGVEQLEHKDGELAQCRAQNALLKKDLDTGIVERVAGVTTALMEENARLHRENEALQGEIKKLRGESSSVPGAPQEQP